MSDSSWPEDIEEGTAWASWDPVMLTEYLTALDPPDPGSELVLEIRRGVLNSDQISVDIRRRLLSPDHHRAPANQVSEQRFDVPWT